MKLSDEQIRKGFANVGKELNKATKELIEPKGGKVNLLNVCNILKKTNLKLERFIKKVA